METIFNALYEQLVAKTPISREAFEAFANSVKIISLKKRDHWVKPGDVCDSIAYVIKGCVRIYFPKDGEERTGQFFFEGAWATDFESLHGDQISIVGIDAIEDAELLTIKNSDLVNIYNQFPECERLGRIIAEETIVDLCNRYRSISSDTAVERYLKLVESRPDILTRVPQHFIASYLGIEPESLSRIRKKITSPAFANV